MSKRKSILAGSAVLALAGTLVMVPSAKADTVTNENISSYFNGNWNSPNVTNGALIAAAGPSGSTGSGLTFSDYNGGNIRFANLATTVLTLTPTLLNSNAMVNTLFNTIYGNIGTPNAVVTFTNSLGATATFDLIGSNTIRDYNNGVNTNFLGKGGNGVTVVNWWNDGVGTDSQRLDAQTFQLPTTWNGSDLVSMTVFDPTASHDNPLLSAVQVVDSSSARVQPPSAVPEPTSLVLFGSGLIGLAGAARRKLAKR